MALSKNVAQMFVHFFNPTNGELEYADPGVGAEFNRRPIGVQIHTNGSATHKAVVKAVAQENLDRRIRKVTADIIESNQVKTTAGCIFEVTNFDAVEGFESLDANDKPGVRAFLSSPDYAPYREQIEEKLGGFTTETAKTNGSAS